MRRYANFFLIATVLALATNAYTDTMSTWNGEFAGWSTAADWTPAVVPNNSAGTGYDVTIGTGEVILDISPTINSLTLNGSLAGPTSGPAPTLTVVNRANIGGDVFFGTAPLRPPTGPAGLSVGGDLDISSSANFGVANQSLTVGGNLTNATSNFEVASASGSDQFKVAGTLTNESTGVLDLGFDRCFTMACPPGNGVFPTLPPIGGPNTSVGTLVNDGTIYSWSSISASTFVNQGSAAFIGGGPNVGTLKNGGTITLGSTCCSLGLEATANINVGTGTPFGLGYNQFANGVLDELLLGNSTYGTIAASIPFGVNGQTYYVPYGASLNGTLDIMLENGFTPAIGESFTILTFAPGDLIGAFSNVEWNSFDNGDGYFVVSYNNTAGDVVITAEALPEPGTLLLLGPALGILFLFWSRQRRLTH